MAGCSFKVCICFHSSKCWPLSSSFLPVKRVNNHFEKYFFFKNNFPVFLRKWSHHRLLIMTPQISERKLELFFSCGVNLNYVFNMRRRRSRPHRTAISSLPLLTQSVEFFFLFLLCHLILHPKLLLRASWWGGATVLVEWFSPGYYLYLMLQTVTGVLSYRYVGVFVSRFLWLERVQLRPYKFLPQAGFKPGT